MDLSTCQVITAQGGNVRFHEVSTADGDYVKHLLENVYQGCDHEVPSTVPVDWIKDYNGDLYYDYCYWTSTNKLGSA